MEPLYARFNSAGIRVLILFIAWFRLFVGDLSNDVSDDVLSNAFNKYTSFQKARVIRDRLSQKVRFGGLSLPVTSCLLCTVGQVWIRGIL